MEKGDTGTLEAPLASIVVRTLGTRKLHLQRALRSLAASTRLPLQVVIVYQGRSQETLAYLRTLAAHHSNLTITIVQNETEVDDRAQNLNLGWSAALGRYLGFLDDDDTIEPGHIQTLVAAMSATGAVWSYGQCLLVKENTSGEPLHRSFPFYRRSFSFQELLIENFIPIHSFLVDREKLTDSLRERPFFRPLKRSEDWDFLIRLAHEHKPAVSQECVCTY
ncbi:MAG: glycosyltransferase family 2 protein, partial [Verrucomicrobiaceae bacterium]